MYHHPARTPPPAWTLAPFAGVLAVLLILQPAPIRAKPLLETPEAVEYVSPGPLAPLSSAASGDTTVIASFSFEDGMGGPDPQGWTGFDVTAQVDTFFHVDDFADLGGLINPISGAQSLWCGSRDSCWALPPGYGNRWGQDFRTLEIGTMTGDVTMTYNILYAMEQDYDYAYVQYQDSLGAWQTLKTYNGYSGGAVPDTVMVPAGYYDRDLNIRFRFESDKVYSDEDGVENSDGAVVLDDIVVTDGSGVVDTQDFEAEAPGAVRTADSHWNAVPRSGFGDRSDLVDGATVVQENGPVNNTHVWGFFKSSPDFYTCGGFPAQRAVPYGPDAEGFYARNWIRSEWIDFTQDENGQPLGEFGQALLEFDVYRDLPLSVGVFYQWKVRWRTNGGCPSAWRNNYIYYGADKSWLRQVGDMTDFIDPAATEIQLALGVFDCGDPFIVIGKECPTGVVGGCHSHAPLFDNVRVVVTAPAQTGVIDDAAPRGTALLAPHPNPARGPVNIAFSLAAPGEVTVDIHDVAGRLVRTLARGPFNEGPTELVWDGRNGEAKGVASGIYFVRLLTGDTALVKRVMRLDGR